MKLCDATSGLFTDPSHQHQQSAGDASYECHHTHEHPAPSSVVLREHSSDSEPPAVFDSRQREPGLDDKSYILRLETRLIEAESREKALRLRHRDLEAANANLLRQVNQLEESNLTVRLVFQLTPSFVRSSCTQPSS